MPEVRGVTSTQEWCGAKLVAVRPEHQPRSAWRRIRGGFLTGFTNERVARLSIMDSLIVAAVQYLPFGAPVAAG
jgi:hypothetical protein